MSSKKRQRDNRYICAKMMGAIVNPVNVALLIFLAYLSFFKPWGKRKRAKGTD
jgi:hypothetical protein